MQACASFLACVDTLTAKLGSFVQFVHNTCFFRPVLLVERGVRGSAAFRSSFCETMKVKSRLGDWKGTERKDSACNIGAMADDAGATSRTEESGLEADEDLFEYLELKRKEVAAMTQAAEIAREQAVHLLRLQRQVQAIESMAQGPGDPEPAQAGHLGENGAGAQAFDGGPVHASTLSLEDRRRFGLEVTPPPSEAIPTPPPSASEVQLYVWLDWTMYGALTPGLRSHASVSPVHVLPKLQAHPSLAGIGKPAILAAALTAAGALGRLPSRRRSSRGFRVIAFSTDTWASDGSGQDAPVDFPDLNLCMVMAGFSFDSYTEIDRAQGVWVSAGAGTRTGLEGVQVVLLSPRFVRDAFSGILRVRVLSAEGLRNVAMAGAVTVFFRTTSGSSAGGLRGFQRNRVRRGVLSGLAQWLDEDDSVYLYVPKGAFAGSPSETEEDSEDPCLHLEVHTRSLLDNSTIAVIGRASIPMSDWSASKKLKELCVELELPKDERKDVEDFLTSPEEGKERPPSRVRLQLEYDAFDLLEDPANSTGADEQLDDVTPEARARRQRFGSNVPAEVRLPDVQRLSEHQLQAALRGRGREALEKRLQKSIAAEKAVYDSDGWWSTVGYFLGTDRKAQLEGAMGAAATAAETLSGDFFAAMGAGIMSGAGEIAGFDELMKGDFAGAMEKRKDVWQAASSEEGRAALRQKADVAVKRAKQQAMIRLAQGMELMSVRKGAWRMLEQAVMDEGAAGSTSFADYEQLAYLEAGSTNTECWVWRLLAGKRIVVAFRGTCDFGDVLTDIAAIPREIGDLGKVHEGFSRAYDSDASLVREALHAVLARGCLGDGEGWKVIFTGHSLGGALATLASLDVSRTIRGLPADFGSAGEVGKILPTPLRGAEIIACTFGAPRVGSARVAAAYDEFVPRAWRIFSTSDVVPNVPPTSLWGFRHAGIGVQLDPQQSELIVRGRTAGLQEAALEEAEAAKSETEEEGGSSLMLSFQGDIWSSFDEAELAELRRVIGTGTTAVGEHMEDNYFARIQECLSETSQSRRSEPVEENPQGRSGELPGEWAWQSQPPTPAETESQAQAAQAPAWSSLSLEDRQRFGLDGQELPPSQRMEAADLNPHLPTAVSRHAVSHHPDVLWGNAGMPGPPSMAKTLAQLEAVGMASNLSRLEESERKLQKLKLG
eukprot:s1448_g3.t1